MSLSRFVYNKDAKTVSGYVICANPEKTALSVIYEDGRDNFPEPSDILYIGDKDGKKSYRVSFSQAASNVPVSITVKVAGEEISLDATESDGFIVFENATKTVISEMTDPEAEQTPEEPKPETPEA